MDTKNIETTKERLLRIINDLLEESIGEGSIDDATAEALRAPDLWEKNIQDLNISSITFIRIVVEIENEFDIEFEDEMLVPEAFLKFSDLETHLDSQLAKMT